MLWLGTSPSSHPNIAAMLDTHQIGLMCQPRSNMPKAGWVWAADNGCFNDKWDEKHWLRWLNKDLPRAGCLFATVPDVVGDHQATLERFEIYAPKVRELAFPVAFVAQDGCFDGDIPWSEFDALFIGGSTDWKMSQAAFEIAVEARDKNKWVHIGRVNSFKRLQYWSAVAHSSDGTHLKFEPEIASVRVNGWINNLRRATQMNILGEG